jgi:glycosyltransferase involved in cell wall biosynthesis
LKILFLCNRVPFPPHDGGAILMYDLVHNLARQGVDVTVLAINTPKHFQPEGVLGTAVRLLTVPVNTNLSVFKALVNLFKSIPYNFERFMSPAYARQLAALLESETFDLIQVEGSQMAWYLPLIRQYSAAPVVLRAHNVEYTIWERLARHEKQFWKRRYFKILARKIKAFEKAYLPLFDAIAAITAEDTARLAALGVASQVAVIPAGVQRERLPLRPDLVPRPKTLFWIGSLNWQPNLEGLDWFLHKVWPALRQAHPDLELHLAGSFQPDFWQLLPLHQVQVHGFVPDAALFMQQYELMLVPLLSGGGMRVKIVEGLALGKAVLTTTVGAEGVQGKAGEHFLVADDAQAWIRLLDAYVRGAWQPGAFQTKARELVDKLYDNEIVVTQYLSLYRELISAKKGRQVGFMS